MNVSTKRDFSEKGVHSFNQIFNGSCDIEKKKRINMIGVQFSSVTQSCPTLCWTATPWTAARQASLSIINSQSLFKLVSIKLVIPSNQLILCQPLLLPSIFPSIRIFVMSWFFKSGGQSIGVSTSASILPMNKSGLISFRIDWFDLLAVQGTLKSLLQHHSSKVSNLWRSVFFFFF